MNKVLGVKFLFKKICYEGSENFDFGGWVGGCVMGNQYFPGGQRIFGENGKLHIHNIKKTTLILL